MKTIKLLSLLFLFTVGFAKAQMDDKFYQTSKEMKPFEFSTKPEEIKFPVDSDIITAFIAKPNQKDIKKTIFFFHGAAGNVTTYQQVTKPLVEAGYQVVMVDFRGYGNSTGVPTHLNIQSDAQKFFDALILRDDIKNTKKYFYGASLGTQIAANLAKNNASKISGLILDSPMSSFTDIAMAYAPDYKEMIAQMLVSPYSAKTDLSDLKSLPKLIIRSDKDAPFFFEQAKVVFDNAAEPKKMLEVSGGHIGGMTSNKAEILKAIEGM